MTTTELLEQLESGDLHPLDVRTPAEFQSVNIKGARNVPLDQIKNSELLREIPKDEKIVLICLSGQRAGMAQKDLAALGYINTEVMDGGMKAWENAGHPVIRGKEVMSMERQVRIAAGFLVLVGTLLGFFVNKGFFGIPAFVGAGLMFAGITDTCAMGMMIAKMPWNRAPAACQASS